MSIATMIGAATAPTQMIHAKKATYAYRRFGHGAARPLLFLQHFVGTLDNWDPAVTDPLATGREVVLLDNASVGRSTGSVPSTVSEMSSHALDFLDAFGTDRCDVIGFSLGGMVASLITFPDYGMVVAVTSNISYADTFSIAVKVAEAYARQRM